MDEKLLLKCDNTIYADEIASLLFEHGIASRQHDERQDTAVGAYGGVTGVAIFVFKKDYEAAKALVAPIIAARNNARPICPCCGSDDVHPLARKSRWGGVIVAACLAMIILPIVYFILPAVFNLRSEVLDGVALLVFFSGWILLFLSRHVNDNFQCSGCGKSFRHFQS